MAILGNDGNSIKLTIPNKGDTDWTEMIKAAFKAIAEHNHTGTEYGYKINTSSLTENCVNEDILQDSETSDASRAVNTNHIKSNAITTDKITNANVTLAKVENVSAARLIVGNSSNRPTSVDVTGDITISNTGVTTIGGSKVQESMLASNVVTTTKIANDNITVDKKQTTEIETMSDPQVLNTGLASDKSFIIHYRIKDGSNFQIGTLSGVSNSCLVDEFVGADLGFEFAFNGNDIEINGASGKDLQYSIEFLE